jgi:hypothetical protein
LDEIIFKSSPNKMAKQVVVMSRLAANVLSLAELGELEVQVQFSTSATILANPC